MPLMLRKARETIPALSGVIPGSDRDLEQSPLTPAEERVIDWVKERLPKAKKNIMRHGMAWDRERYEQWQRHYANPENVSPPRHPDGHHAAGKTWSAHVGTWYECQDCKARTGKSVIRVSFLHGNGVMIGERKEYIETKFDPLKWSRGQQGADVDTKRAITLYTGWICPACERARYSEQRKKLRGEREAAKQQEAEQLGSLINEPQPEPEEQLV
jgi:hypothetical protein